MHSTRYIYTFVFIMTAIVAIGLALMFTALEPIHDRNEANYNKKAILASLGPKIDGDLNSMSQEDIQQIFDTKIEQLAVDTKGNVLSEAQLAEMADGAVKAEEIDMAQQKKKPEDDRVLPFYVYTGNDGNKYYIISMRGNGLWDEIWGNVALESDLNTIAGVDFDHRAETPGLGAEIKDNSNWKEQYIGKKIYVNGELNSVKAIKGGAKNAVNEVDGLSGATITANGVNDMMEKGLKLYQPYFNKLKQS